MAKSKKKMLRQMFSVFEPEQYLEMGNCKYSYGRYFMILLQIELVWFFFVFFFVLVHSVYSNFWLCSYC